MEKSAGNIGQFIITLHGMYKTYITGEIQNDWIKSNANITNIEKNPDNKFTISYTYDINGTTYTLEQIVNNQDIDIIQLVTKMNAKSPVDIYYNLYDHSEACIYKTHNSIALSSFAPIIVFILIYVIVNPTGYNHILIQLLMIMTISGFVFYFYYLNKK